MSIIVLLYVLHAKVLIYLH